MPGLILFNRILPFASDDFWVLGVSHLILHIILLGINLYLVTNFPSACNSSIWFYLLLVCTLLACESILDTVIIITSSSGTIANEYPRRHLSKYLYAAISFMIIQFGCQLYGYNVFPDKSNGNCFVNHYHYFNIMTYSIYTMIVVPIIFFAFLLLILLSSSPKVVSAHEVPRHMHRAITPLFWTSSYLHRDHHISPKNIISEVAEILTEIFGTTSFCVSDVTVGLILVRKRQLSQQFNDHISCSSGSPTDDTIRVGPRYGKASLASTEPYLTNIGIITHLSQYAEATYGIPLYMFANLTRGCGYMCCPHAHSEISSPIMAIERTMDTGMASMLCCFPGSWIKDTSHPDLLHKSIHGKLFKSPFAVSVDHKLKSIIISIRGTLSTTDLLVDLLIKDLEIHWNQNGIDYTGITHKGIYQIATTIFEEIKEYHLFEAFQRSFSDYGIICTGHSLGGGVSSLLAFIIKQDPDTIQYANRTIAVCFSPPGCLISESGLNYFKSFCTTIVLDCDFICRLNQKNVHTLKHQILGELKQCHRHKAEILSSVLIDQLFKSKHDRTEVHVNDLPHIPEFSGTMTFLPGNVLHIMRKPSSSTNNFHQTDIDDNLIENRNSEDMEMVPYWVDAYSLSEEIPISMLMAVDHLPNRVGDVLRSLVPNEV
ncbi:hypothetical protein BC833DRAFT_582816 [Globomyces pollinis-pini]|nr:hypothetical protein BC833DRAFT_582816 [Globomyces pollinis-pini]